MRSLGFSLRLDRNSPWFVKRSMVGFCWAGKRADLSSCVVIGSHRDDPIGNRVVLGESVSVAADLEREEPAVSRE